MELPKIAGYSFEEISDKIKERVDFCKNCEYITSMRTCSKCGCFMPAKTLLPFMKCPIDKWGRFEQREPTGEN
jgi:hypothetical protein